jgi:hypothetical protein
VPPRLKGNQVKILSGPATVTGDELLMPLGNREGAGKMIRKPGNLPVDKRYEPSKERGSTYAGKR